MASYKIFFPMTRIPKAQLAGDGNGHTDKANRPKRQAPKWDGPIPTYKTQSDVTTAIADGVLKVGSLQAYDDAKRYERYLKLVAQFEAGFIPNAPKPRANGVYNHCMGFSR